MACPLEVLCSSYEEYEKCGRNEQLLEKLKDSYWQFIQTSSSYDQITAEDFQRFLDRSTSVHCKVCAACSKCKVEAAAWKEKVLHLENVFKKCHEVNQEFIVAGEIIGQTYELYDEYIQTFIGKGLFLGNLHTPVNYALFVLEHIDDIDKAYAYLNEVALKFTHLNTSARLDATEQFNEQLLQLNGSISKKKHKNFLLTLVHGGDKRLEMCENGFKRAVELWNWLKAEPFADPMTISQLVKKMKATRYLLHRKSFIEIQDDEAAIKKRIHDFFVKLNSKRASRSKISADDLLGFNVLLSGIGKFVTDPSHPLKRNQFVIPS